MHTQIKAVIFDLDGVIIDSNPAIESFWKSWTDKENITLTNAMICEWIYGRKVGDTISGVFDHLHPDRKKEIHVSAHAFDSTMQPGAISGVIEFIQALSILQIPTGVVTSSHHSRMLKMLEQIGISEKFVHFITAHDVTHGKPHPEPYLKMKEKMNIASEHCLVFEDAISGIQSARSAGMHAIGIGDKRTAESLLSAGACAVVPDFAYISLNNNLLYAADRVKFSLT